MRIDGSHAKHIGGTYFGNWMILWYTDRLFERPANTFISTTLLNTSWKPFRGSKQLLTRFLVNFGRLGYTPFKSQAIMLGGGFKGCSCSPYLGKGPNFRKTRSISNFPQGQNKKLHSPKTKMEVESNSPWKRRKHLRTTNFRLPAVS